MASLKRCLCCCPHHCPCAALRMCRASESGEALACAPMWFTGFAHRFLRALMRVAQRLSTHGWLAMRLRPRRSPRRPPPPPRCLLFLATRPIQCDDPGFSAQIESSPLVEMHWLKCCLVVLAASRSAGHAVAHCTQSEACYIFECDLYVRISKQSVK
jgi:hypothetical protein